MHYFYFFKTLFIFQGRLHVKVLQVSETKTTSTRFGDKTMCITTVGDKTGVITLPLWEAKTTMVQANKCYHMTNMVTKLYDSQLPLSTTMTLEINEINKDIETPLDKPNETFQGSIVPVNNI